MSGALPGRTSKGGHAMPRRIRTLTYALLMAVFLFVPTLAPVAQAQNALPVASRQQQLTLAPEQRRLLETIARDTWNFYGYNADVDPNTDLPRDNIGFNGAPAQGNYTSPTNIGLYLWSIVAAQDMHIINRHEELDR